MKAALERETVNPPGGGGGVSFPSSRHPAFPPSIIPVNSAARLSRLTVQQVAFVAFHSQFPYDSLRFYE